MFDRVIRIQDAGTMRTRAADAAKPITVLLCAFCTHPNEKCTQFPVAVLSCALYQNQRPLPTFSQVTCVAWPFPLWARILRGGEAQTAQHGVRRAAFALRIQMRVDVRRGTEIAVPQPLLNLLERHMVCKQEAGT